MSAPTPILLLKTASPSPQADPYTTALTTPSSDPSPTTFTPYYIPVLTHTLLPDPLISLLTTHLSPPSQPSPPTFPYGAILLTSQRAVAALLAAIKSPPIQNRKAQLLNLELIFYVVGPATERVLREGVRDEWMPRCRIVGGEKAGSGESLGRVMLGREGGGDGRYEVRKGDGDGGAGGGKGLLKPVLFLTGEKRRDILPRMLMDPALGPKERIQVDEMVVYETKELEEFAFGFGKALRETEAATICEEGGVRWVVVFSPTAGKGMLKELGWLDEGTGSVKEDFDFDGGGSIEGRRTFMCCIGPTTREYLEVEFGFRADVMAERPSPQGVREGIERFMKERKTNR